mgnify:CR=1 FL=1
MALNFPSSPSNGDLYENYIYNSTEGTWQLVSIDNIYTGASISGSAPSSPVSGDMWWDSDNGTLFIYYNDGTNSQWVDAAGPGVAVQDTAPTGYEGQLWLDSTDGSMYVYYTDPGGSNSQWIGAVSNNNTAGNVVQVVNTHYTDTFSTSSSTPSNVPGFSATITPKSSTNKILVLFQSWVGYSANDNYPYFLMKRNGNSIGTAGVATGNQIDTFVSTPALSRDANTTQPYKLLNASRSYLDSPASTSSLTYQVQFAEPFDGTSYVNRTHSQLDTVYTQFPGSDLTLMEIEA